MVGEEKECFCHFLFKLGSGLWELDFGEMGAHFYPQVCIAAQTILFRFYLEEITDVLATIHALPGLSKATLNMGSKARMMHNVEVRGAAK